MACCLAPASASLSASRLPSQASLGMCFSTASASVRWLFRWHNVMISLPPPLSAMAFRTRRQ
eukprot:5279700-Pyramimonas_sp.AAC.1